MIARRLTSSVPASAIPRITRSINPTYRLAQMSTYTASAVGALSQKIIHDHEELDDYYHKMLSAPDVETKRKYQNQFVWELARHSIAEELVVYPAFEKYITSGGKEMADKDREEHLVLKKELYTFQGLEATDPSFEPTIKKLYADLKQHIAEEERDDLPKLEQVIPRDESERLAKSFQRTKMFVPTRSHPSAPDKPVRAAVFLQSCNTDTFFGQPFETVAGLLAAPLDKLGDIFRSFPEKP